MDTAPRPKSTRRIVGMFVCALFVPLSVLTSLAPSGNVAHANGTPWSQVGLDIDGVTPGDSSGVSVAMSSDGSRVAVGEPSYDITGKSNVGRVRVYGLVNGQWNQVGEDIIGEARSDQSGYSVAMSADGTRVAIGAPYNDGADPVNCDDCGHVRIYEWDGNSWSQLGADIDGGMGGDQSGTSVAMSSDGTHVVIGAPFHLNEKGRARVYELNDNSWSKIGDDLTDNAGGAVGQSVAMSADGTRIAIGAPSNDGFKGRVLIYERDSNLWLRLGADIVGEAPQDQSGYSVAMSADGTRVAIGAPYNDGAEPNAGHVRVYQLNVSNAWVQLGADIDGEGEEDQSGYSVAMSSDGTRVAIGTPSYDVTVESANVGHVRVFELNGNSWSQFGANINGEAGNDYSGWSIAMSSNGTRLAIGAPFNNSSAGHVRVFTSVPIDETPDPDDENPGGGTPSGGNNPTGNSNAGNNSGGSKSNDPTPGTYTSTVDSKKVDVAVTSDENGGVTVENNRFNTTFQSSTSGKNNELFLPQGDNLSVRGKGFKPGTRVKVRIPKSNMSIGASTVSDDGSFVSQFTIPRSLRAGTHVMTLQGRDKDGKLISIQTTVKVDKLKKATVKRFRVYSNALSQKLRRQTNRVVKQNPTMTAAHCQGFVKPSKINNPKDIARATKRAKSVCKYIQKRNKGVHTTIGFAASRENRRRVEVSYR